MLDKKTSERLLAVLTDLAMEAGRAAAREVLAERGEAPDEWIDKRSAKSLGLEPRAFLRLATAGAFPVSKVRRKTIARRADVVAYLEAQRVEPKPSDEQREADDPIMQKVNEGRLRLVTQ